MFCSPVEISLSSLSRSLKINGQNVPGKRLLTNTLALSPLTRGCLRFPDAFAVGWGHGTSSGQQAGLKVARVPSEPAPGPAGSSHTPAPSAAVNSGAVGWDLSRLGRTAPGEKGPGRRPRALTPPCPSALGS